MGDLDKSGTFQRVLDNMDKSQKRLDESLRQLTALSTNPLTRRNFMRRLLRRSRSEKDEPCTKPKQKQSQELPRRSRNQMRREQISFTGQAAWTPDQICGIKKQRNK